MAETDQGQSLKLARGIEILHRQAAALRAVAVATATRDARRALNLTLRFRIRLNVRRLSAGGGRGCGARSRAHPSSHPSAPRPRRARGGQPRRWWPPLRSAILIGRSKSLAAIRTHIVGRRGFVSSQSPLPFPDLDLALRLTREIDDQERRAATVRAGSGRGREARPRAGAAARQGIRASQLESRRDQCGWQSTLALLTRSEALEVGMGIQDPRVRAEALGAVVAAVAETAPERALQMARGIPDPP